MCASRRSANPTPHFHARYGEYEAQVEIATGAVLINEYLPRRATQLVAEWARLRRAEPDANWDRASSEQPLDSIEPLP